MNNPLNMSTLSETSFVVASADQVSSDLAGETIILNLKAGMYYSLDAVGSRIWSLIQEKRSVRDLRNIIFEEYKVEFDRCESDLLALLQELYASGLVEVKDESLS